jgi:hypothetical protein
MGGQDVSVNPCWIRRCKTCGAVEAFSGVRDGDEAAAVLFVSGARKNGDGSEVVRLTPGDEGYPPSLDELCGHPGGTYDPNQASPFDPEVSR